MTIRTGDPIPGTSMLRHQASLVKLLESLGARERTLYAVEVGVWEGETSEVLLRALPLLHLTMVDAWLAPEADSGWRKSGDRVARQTQEVFEAAYEKTVERTNFASDRRALLRTSSAVAARAVYWTALREAYLPHLVFIDAAHDYDSVAADIRAWAPLVREGGILSGHDYSHRRFVGVKQAVDEWAAESDRVVRALNGKVWWTQMGASNALTVKVD